MKDCEICGHSHFDMRNCGGPGKPPGRPYQPAERHKRYVELKAANQPMHPMYQIVHWVLNWRPHDKSNR